MKIIVIGLGNFGQNLALALMQEGHEVIGVDNNMEHIERVKNDLTIALKLDATELTALRSLPFQATDLVVIAIGEDVGASLTSLAQVKKIFSGRIIARAITDVQYSILETIKIDDIVEPEKEFAEELAKRIAHRKILKSINLPGTQEIVIIPTPEHLIGKNIHEILIENSNISIITIITAIEKKNLFGTVKFEKVTLDSIPDNYQLHKEDNLVLFGTNKHIDDFVSGM